MFLKIAQFLSYIVTLDYIVSSDSLVQLSKSVSDFGIQRLATSRSELGAPKGIYFSELKYDVLTWFSFLSPVSLWSYQCIEDG